MKTLKIIIIALLSIHCKAQPPVINIIDIENADGFPTTGVYYRDTNSLLNPFVGTYLYTNGTTSFKIILVKKVQQYNGRYSEDLIIGEYQYIENGIEKVNTLNEINTVYNDQRSHNIDGNFVVNNNFREWKCPACPTNEKRLSLSIRDVATERYAHIGMRRTTENGQEVMKIKISHVSGGNTYEVGQPLPPDFSLPQGEFTFIKL